MNKSLWIVLAVVGLAAGGFWLYRALAHRSEVVEAREAVQASAPKQVTLYCSSCREWIALPEAEAAALERQNDKMRCPKCKRFTLGDSSSAPVKVVAP